MAPAGDEGSMVDEIRLDDLERPEGLGNRAIGWGSDAIAETLRRLDARYVAMVPGSSYRGLQDSLVNYLGNTAPQMLVCLHEEHAVAIAHGYAKVADRPMAAAVHSNVGLMHATMAIYNAYCDRAPVLVLGATGPVDASARRPWIDWIHTSRDQGALVRGYVKWDDQPASPAAGVEATLRAWQLINAHPRGPAYICYDVSDQEMAVDAKDLVPADVGRYTGSPATRPSAESVAAAAELLRGATRIVVLAGRASRDEADWERRIQLVERLGARVVSDLKMGAAFPTAHPLHVPGAAQFLGEAQKAAIREADLVLSLDWMDLGGALRQSLATGSASPRVISATLDDGMINGWSLDHYALPPVDVRLASTSDAAVAELLAAVGSGSSGFAQKDAAQPAACAPAGMPEHIDLAFLARSLNAATSRRKPTFLRFPLGWPSDETPFDHPLSYVGADGGAGIGSGPGMAVGGALALLDSGRLPVAVLGDGDFVMGASAIWTAARYRLPLLVVVSNNRSYFNDEIHQETMARTRGRPIENRWIGQRLDDPPVDIPGLAASLGARSCATVEAPADLGPALATAIEAVEKGGVFVLDVRVTPGYASPMPATTD